MVFAHDTEASLLAAVALVNSAEPPDTMTTPAQLDAFYAAHSYTGGRTHDDAELAAVRALRPPLRALLTADRDEAVGIGQRRSSPSARAVPQLVRHDGWDYHLHATDPAAPLADRIAVETAMAMVDVIRADELSRLVGVRRRHVRRPRPRPLAQPLPPLLQRGLREPDRGRGLPGTQGLTGLRSASPQRPGGRVAVYRSGRAGAAR